MKVREKNCNECTRSFDVLYRCKYACSGWSFLCQECLRIIKGKYSDYVYGGTWKARK